MVRMVDIDDLVDAHGVAVILGLSKPNSVHTYRKRYDSFPAPVMDLGERRARLWSRKEILNWKRLRP